WKEAIAAVHAPQSDADLLPATPVRERLAYDEILASQLAVALVRARRRRRPGRVLAGTGKLQARAEAGFGFALTGAQRQALAEIAGDMKAPHQMMRLLQGDVGSGKTVVALTAMLIGVEQRLALPAKGHDSDTLLMSATPIPRTLMMTAYGDLDVSRLVEKPPGRRPVDTRTVPLDRAEEVTGAVARALARGAKVFWVC